MALPGETIYLGASPHCPDCNKELKEEVLQSAAGYFIGTRCCCGPYTRESSYYAHEDLAQAALDTGLTDYRKGTYFER